MYEMTPTEKQSTFRPYGCFSSTSGAAGFRKSSAMGRGGGASHFRSAFSLLFSHTRVAGCAAGMCQGLVGFELARQSKIAKHNARVFISATVV